MAKLLVRVVALLLIITTGVTLAQVAIPTLGSRGEASSLSDDEMTALIERFSDELREAVAARGLEVTQGELITPGIAGSLDPEISQLIADLDGVRYAISGEIAVAEESAQDPFVVNMIVVDSQQDRSTDLISRPLSPDTVSSVAAGLARTIVRFTEQAASLPVGNAGLFVSSQPGEAEIYLNGVRVGVTPSNEVLMLAPGRYQLELRKEGFLPEVRTIELNPNATTLENVHLIAISGGSILVESRPNARVYLDGVEQGLTPLFIPAPPGVATVRLVREGFTPVTASVPVRNYRTSRLELQLDPVQEPLLFWELDREYFVLIDGLLQNGSYARNVEPGMIEVELRRGRERRHLNFVLPARGVFKLDLESGELIRLDG